MQLQRNKKESNEHVDKVALKINFFLALNYSWIYFAFRGKLYHLEHLIVIINFYLPNLNDSPDPPFY